VNRQDKLTFARQYAERKIKGGARIADACEAASATYGIPTDKKGHEEAGEAPARTRRPGRVRQDVHGAHPRREPLGKKTAFVDTEPGARRSTRTCSSFDVIELGPPFHPDRAVEAIGVAVEAGYDTVIVDSLSHFWQGDGGLLDIVDEIARTKYRGDSHRAWKDGGEIEQRLINAILRSPLHVIGAMRTKKDYVREEVDGKTKIRAGRHEDDPAGGVRLRVRPRRPLRRADRVDDR
jgi:hypothetical protein